MPQKAPDRTPDKSGNRDLPGDKKKSQKDAGPKDQPGKDKSTLPQKSDREPSGQKAAPGTKKEADKKDATQPRPQLSDEQRTKVKSVFSKHRQQAPHVTVNFDVSVGVRVPRTIRLAVIPQDILVIVPAYRTYRYFVVDNRICIVDPATLVIVDVILIV